MYVLVGPHRLQAYKFQTFPMLSSLQDTFPAEASHLDVSCLNLTQGAYRVRQSDVIKIIAVEITGESTLSANKMMVVLQVGVETGPSAARTKQYHQPKILQQPECPVDGVKRDGWHTVPDTLENLISIRVIPCLRNFTENFHALVRQLDPFAPANRLEDFHPLVNFFLLDFHNHPLAY